MRPKRRNKRGPHGEVSQLGDWSPVLWRYRVALILITAVVVYLVTVLVHVL